MLVLLRGLHQVLQQEWLHQVLQTGKLNPKPKLKQGDSTQFPHLKLSP